MNCHRLTPNQFGAFLIPGKCIVNGQKLAYVTPTLSRVRTGFSYPRVIPDNRAEGHMARRTLTDSMVAALKCKQKRYNHPDPGMPGHYVRVSATGTKSYAVAARDPNGK
jgi:hypothetical protein